MGIFSRRRGGRGGGFMPTMPPILSGLTGFGPPPPTIAPLSGVTSFGPPPVTFGAPLGGLGGPYSFAENVDAFDGAAITSEGAPKPPTASIHRGHPARDVLPSATGRPSGIQLHDGTDNARAQYTTFEAGNTRPESSSGRGPSAPQFFNDSTV